MTHIVHVYWWLENNNLWKSVVAFIVTLVMGILLGLLTRPWHTWKKNRAIQEKIADRLDASTPGGLSDVVNSLEAVIRSLEGGDEPDDNGTDPEGAERRIIPRVTRGGHGGSSASHR